MHDGFQFALVHLAVADCDAWWSIEELMQAFGNALDALDAVVEVEDLAAAGEFALNDLPDDAFIERRDVGFDRQAVHGRGLDHAHVARAGQRHV